MDGEEKARILAWRQENVTIKEICIRTNRAKSSVMALLAAARDLPQDVTPAIKHRSGRPRKTSRHTNDVLRRELRKNPHLCASELKEMFSGTSPSDASSTACRRT